MHHQRPLGTFANAAVKEDPGPLGVWEKDGLLFVAVVVDHFFCVDKTSNM